LAALDKNAMSEKEYKAQAWKIKFDYQKKLYELESREVERILEINKRLTESLVIEAQNRTEKLTGAEGLDFQKKVWDQYYTSRLDQLEKNAKAEKNLIEASAKTREEKDNEIRLIEANLESGRIALKKERTEK
jgi:hypothetical protein